MTRFLSYKRLIFCCFALMLGPCPALAQGSATGSANPAASSADQQIPPAIAKELEGMKKRIDELEAQLKSKNAQQQSSAAQASANAASPVTAPSPAPEARQSPRKKR